MLERKKLKRKLKRRKKKRRRKMKKKKLRRKKKRKSTNPTINTLSRTRNLNLTNFFALRSWMRTLKRRFAIFISGLPGWNTIREKQKRLNSYFTNKLKIIHKLCRNCRRLTRHFLGTI